MPASKRAAEHSGGAGSSRAGWWRGMQAPLADRDEGRLSKV